MSTPAPARSRGTAAEDAEAAPAPDPCGDAARSRGGRQPGEAERARPRYSRARRTWPPSPPAARPTPARRCAASPASWASICSLVKGSGPKGRILKEDVQGFVKRALAQGGGARRAGALPFALPAAARGGLRQVRPGGESRNCRASRSSAAGTCTAAGSRSPTSPSSMRRTSPSWRPSARPRRTPPRPQGVKLTFLPFLLKAVATALNRMPSLKASLTAGRRGAGA